MKRTVLLAPLAFICLAAAACALGPGERPDPQLSSMRTDDRSASEIDPALHITTSSRVDASVAMDMAGASTDPPAAMSMDASTDMAMGAMVMQAEPARGHATTAARATPARGGGMKMDGGMPMDGGGGCCKRGSAPMPMPVPTAPMAPMAPMGE